MLTFYYHPRSTFSRRVHVALLEKEIPHKKVLVDLAGKEHRKSAYTAVNPYSRVPAIDDDGLILYESASILSYLEATRPERPLLPSSVRERALVDMHLRLCDGQFARHVGVIIFPKRFLPPERWDQEAMARAKREIDAHLAILGNVLRGRQYLVGEALSIADIAYLPFLHFMSLMEVSAPPPVAEWSERLLSRPTAQFTVPDL